MPGHAFSLLEVKTVDIKGQTLDVLKIFNPYNRNLYNGKILDQQSYLSKEAKNKLKL